MLLLASGKGLRTRVAAEPWQGWMDMYTLFSPPDENFSHLFVDRVALPSHTIGKDWMAGGTLRTKLNGLADGIGAP